MKPTTITNFERIRGKQERKKDFYVITTWLNLISVSDIIWKRYTHHDHATLLHLLESCFIIIFT
jgi:hypothetical protein